MKLNYWGWGLCLALARYPLSFLLSDFRSDTKPKEWEPEEKHWIKCPSGNILYVEFDGPENQQALVLLHGLNSNRLQWFYQRKFFRERFRLIMVDLPGHGNSGKAKSLEVSVIADDLTYLLSYFNVQQPILYGHSMGGMTIMELMSRVNRKQQIKAVILQHCTYTNPLRTCSFSTVLWGMQRIAINPFIFLVKDHPAVFRLLNWIYYLIGLQYIFMRFNFFTGHQTAAQLRYISEISAGNPPETAVEGLRKLLKFNVKTRMKNIDVPTLIIAGEQDRLTSPSASRFIHSQIKNSRLELVEGGHLSILENYRPVNYLINQFIRTI